MPKRYEDFLREAVANDKKFRRCDARNALIIGMELGGKSLPADFPTDHQVKKGVSYFRGLEKKRAEKGMEKIRRKLLAVGHCGNVVSRCGDVSQVQ